MNWELPTLIPLGRTMLSHRFSAYSAMESKAFSRLGEILVLVVRSNAVHSAREIGWALVTLLLHGEVEHHADSRMVFAL